MAIELDHLMWGAPTLEAGIEEAQRLFGERPAIGGVHPGLGTRNALLSLGDGVYLEVIAPDPAQELAGTLGGRLAGLDGCGLITWAARSPDLRGLAEKAAGLELAARGPVPTERRTPDGGLLKWELLFLGGHQFPGLVPFFIDWLDTPHPATTNPRAGLFRSLEIRTPDAGSLNRILAGLGMDVTVVESETVDLIAAIEVAGHLVHLNKAPGSEGWTI